MARAKQSMDGNTAAAHVAYAYTEVADDLYEVQVVSWYDNENSYTSQMVRTIKYFSENC